MFSFPMMLFFAQLIRTIVQLAFQQLDDELSNRLKEQGFGVDRKSQRTITFLFGSITFVRRRMKNKEGEIRKGAQYSSLVLSKVEKPR